MTSDQRALLQSLVRASAEIRAAAIKATEQGREDIAQLLRQGGWKVAAAIADLHKDRPEATS